jgi:hypothetical protein
MFGFGRKKIAAPMLLDEAVQKRFRALIEIQEKFPSKIPQSDTTVALIAAEVAKIVTSRFSLQFFEAIFAPVGLLDDRYPSGRSRTDMLALWYSLGLICLTHCSITNVWSEALTVDVGCQVYDATVASAWAFWAMPDPVRERVELFMGSNITHITRSLRTVVDARSKTIWFARYSERILRGANPQWEVSFSGPPGGWRAKFGDAIFDDGDIKFGRFLLTPFEETANLILNAVSGANHAVKSPTTPRDLASTWHDTFKQSKVNPAPLDVDEDTETEADPRLDPDLTPTPERVKELYEAWKNGKLSEALNKVTE